MYKNSRRLLLAFAGLALSSAFGPVAVATPLSASKAIEQPAPLVEQVARFARRGGFARGGMARRSTFVGPRGGVARTTTMRRGAVGYRGGVVRPGWHGAGTRWVGPNGWVRPGRYWWPVGGAVAAGAAIGWVTAATAATWAGAAPGPGMCWYYTNASHTQGFWDACP
jgi:hypothetical protein